MRAAWVILQHDEPDDFVMPHVSHSVRNFLHRAFGQLDLDWEEHVVVDPRYFRLAEVDVLQGDTGKAERILGRRPEVGFEDLVSMMVVADLEVAKRERALIDAGLKSIEWAAADED